MTLDQRVSEAGKPRSCSVISQEYLKILSIVSSATEGLNEKTEGFGMPHEKTISGPWMGTESIPGWIVKVVGGKEYTCYLKKVMCGEDIIVQVPILILLIDDLLNNLENFES